MAPQELDKVLSIKFYAEFTKRNGDTNKLESLKITQSVFKRENYPRLGIAFVQSREFHNSKEIHRRITPAANLKFLLQRQREVSASTTEERKVFHH